MRPMTPAEIESARELKRAGASWMDLARRYGRDERGLRRTIGKRLWPDDGPRETEPPVPERAPDTARSVAFPEEPVALAQSHKRPPGDLAQRAHEAALRATDPTPTPAPEAVRFAGPCEEPPSPPRTSVSLQDIVRLTGRKPVHVDTLCTRLMVEREDLLAEIREAQAAGAQIDVVDGYVGTRVRIGGGDVVVMGDASPGRKLVAHVSDLHAGSKYFDREALLRFLHHAWDRGARVLVNSGDNLDGHKDVLLLEQRAVGFDAQAEELVEVWRKAPPFEVVAIDGNHDGYHSNACGFVSGKLLEARMREADIAWTFAGVCLGRAVVHGARWMMWHPHGGASTRNALRRILNERIEAMREPLDVLVMGHFHKYSCVAAYPEGVFGFSSGTFQRKGSEFANRITRPWDTGGVLVSYDIDAKGRASHTAAEFVEA